MLVERTPRAYTAMWYCDQLTSQSNLGNVMTVHAGVDLDYSPTICNLHYHWNKLPRFIPPAAKAVILYCENIKTTVAERKENQFIYSDSTLLISISLEDILKPAVGPGYGPFCMTHKIVDDLIFKAGYDCFFELSKVIEVYKEFDSDVKATLSFNII